MLKANLLFFAYSFAGQTKFNNRRDCTWQLADAAARSSDWPDSCLGAGNLACSQSSLQGQECWEVGLGWEVSPACHTSNRLQRETWAFISKITDPYRHTKHNTSLTKILILELCTARNWFPNEYFSGCSSSIHVCVSTWAWTVVGRVSCRTLWGERRG